MQYPLLMISLAAAGMAIRRMVFWRRYGFLQTARRVYTLAAWCVGSAACASMVLQEGLLFFSGQLTWGNALPLHLCSLLGLLTLPMLLTRSPLLWYPSLFLGLPGALLALVFPAVAQTPWPRLTELAFHALHCALVLAPLLPLGLGMQPRPWGAAWAMSFLVLLGCVALTVNTLTGGNYLFLNLPAPGTPLDTFARWGLRPYRLLLAGASALVLCAEALAAALLQKKQGWKSLQPWQHHTR